MRHNQVIFLSAMMTCLIMSKMFDFSLLILFPKTYHCRRKMLTFKLGCLETKNICPNSDHTNRIICTLRCKVSLKQSKQAPFTDKTFTLTVPYCFLFRISYCKIKTIRTTRLEHLIPTPLSFRLDQNFEGFVEVSKIRFFLCFSLLFFYRVQLPFF